MIGGTSWDAVNGGIAFDGEFGSYVHLCPMKAPPDDDKMTNCITTLGGAMSFVADFSFDAAMAKRFATNACTDAISKAMAIHGGMGLTEEVGLEQLWRDARMLTVPDATDEILTLIQGREITGIAAFR